MSQKTKTKSVTGAKLALATAALLMASSLAFIAIPGSQKKDNNLHVQKKDFRKTQQQKVSQQGVVVQKNIEHQMKDVPRISNQKKYIEDIENTNLNEERPCDPSRQIPNQHGGCISLCPPEYVLSENREECFGREPVSGGGYIMLYSQAINDPPCGEGATEQLIRIEDPSRPFTEWNWKRLCNCPEGYELNQNNSCETTCGENAVLAESSNSTLQCTCVEGERYLDRNNRVACCGPNERRSNNNEECIRQ